MPAELIDGTGIARKIRVEVAERVAETTRRGVRPGLTVILVGDDPASAVYVRAKERASAEAGIDGRTIRLPPSVPEDELLSLIDSLNADPLVHGILVQMPLPSHIAPGRVIERIDPAKDVDGFHPVNVGRLLTGDRSGFAPCTPAGVQELLARCEVPTHGANCVVVGRSNIVGKPMMALMVQDRLGANATVTICHRYTRDLAEHTRRADVVVVATGRPGLIRGDMLKPGAAVIDVGITRVPSATSASGFRLVGDVDFESASAVAGMITPVPGGVGPMTIAMLLSNSVRAAEACLA